MRDCVPAARRAYAWGYRMRIRVEFPPRRFKGESQILGNHPGHEEAGQFEDKGGVPKRKGV